MSLSPIVRKSKDVLRVFGSDLNALRLASLRRSKRENVPEKLAGDTSFFRKQCLSWSQHNLALARVKNKNSAAASDLPTAGAA